MIIGAAVLVAGYLVYKKFYSKPAAPAAPAQSPEDAAAAAAAALAADEATLQADEDLSDEVITGASTPESFLGRGKKKGKPMGNRKERIAKFYLGLLKRGIAPLAAQEMIAKKIKGNKSSKQNQAAAMVELAEVVSTPKETLNEVKEARVVGGGDGFMSQSFMM
jgi:hypothetical protein